MEVCTNKKKNFKKGGPQNIIIDELKGYKKLEKTYRSYMNIKTDFSKVFDINMLKNTCDVIETHGKTIYKLKLCSGAYIIKNFLTPKEQLSISKKLINDYIKKPYTTNLDATKNSEDLTLFVKDTNSYCFNNKIRWSNIGFKYDWGNRRYPDEKTNLPTDLIKICEYTKEIFENEIQGIENFQPESVIINYYGEKDFMGGHLDDGELDQESPILSYQIGLSCVFLIGGISKLDEPIPILLESGDLFVMSGFSRKCYHGVPRVIENSFDPSIFMNLIEIENAPEEWLSDGSFRNNDFHTINYLKTHRLNFNFRRVIPEYNN